MAAVALLCLWTLSGHLLMSGLPTPPDIVTLLFSNTQPCLNQQAKWAPLGTSEMTVCCFCVVTHPSVTLWSDTYWPCMHSLEASGRTQLALGFFAMAQNRSIWGWISCGPGFRVGGAVTADSCTAEVLPKKSKLQHSPGLVTA